MSACTSSLKHDRRMWLVLNDVPQTHASVPFRQQVDGKAAMVSGVAMMVFELQEVNLANRQVEGFKD